MGKLFKVIGRIILTFYEHIDMVWLWLRREGQQAVLSTWRSALDRLSDHPQMTYVITASEYVRVPAEHDPSMMAELQQYANEGRLQILGGLVTEADCHVPSGEAFARLELHGRAEIEEFFPGSKVNITINPDAFGLDKGVIQIFLDAGSDASGYLRPSDPHESDLPRVFWWDDGFGRRILTFRLTEGYNAGPNTFAPRVDTCMKDMEVRYLDNTLMFAGPGNHGGDMSKQLLDRSEYLREYFPIEHGTVEEYLKRIDLSNLPVVTGDKLKHHARGSYSANLRYKQQIRKTEQLLLASEKMLALLGLTGLPEAERIVRSHSTQLKEAWRMDFLPSLFHDLAAGTAIRAGHEQAMDNLAAARSVAQRAIDVALVQITWNIKTPGNAEVTPIVVFNPSGQAARIPTEVSIESHTLKLPRLKAADGTSVACQLIRSDSVTSSRKRIVFMAEVPADGYRTYWLSEDGQVVQAAAEATDTMIRTDLLELRIDPRTGQIAQLVDRRTGWVDLKMSPIVLKDHSDTWSHVLSEYTGAAGKFGRAKVHLAEHGPVRSVIVSHSRYGTSELVQEYIVYAGLPTVEIRSKLLWTGRRQVLKYDFEHGLRNEVLKIEGSYGYNTDRDAGEQPMQRWLNVTGETANGVQASFSVITDSLHAYDAPKGHVRPTVLRTAVYAHHDPQVLHPERLDYDYMDLGEHNVRMLVTVGPETADVAQVSAAAAQFNQPPLYLVSTLRPTATLPQTASFARVIEDDIQITACKRSLKDDGWVVRLFNPAGKASKATLQFGKHKAVVEMGPSAFATVMMPDDSYTVREVNILEKER